ncbi:MAG: ribonuclease P protein component [Deltaproteobacteria bacterium]|nr:ribonuclease P protein component [Deltaproteobacteria bacterium]
MPVPIAALAAPVGRFGRRDRLCRQRQVRRVLRRGVRRQGAHLHLTVSAAVPPPQGRPRLAIAVGRAAGHAPARARLRRLVRAAFRALRPGWPTDAECVVAVRAPWPLARLADLCAELHALAAPVFAQWPPADRPERRRP